MMPRSCRAERQSQPATAIRVAQTANKGKDPGLVALCTIFTQHLKQRIFLETCPASLVLGLPSHGWGRGVAAIFRENGTLQGFGLSASHPLPLL